MALIQLAAFALARPSLLFNGSPRQPNSAQSVALTLDFAQLEKTTIYEIGVRNASPAALQSWNTTCDGFDQVAGTLSNHAYQTRVSAPRYKGRMTLRLLSAPGFAGTYSITAYVKVAGATSDVVTLPLLISVGTLPSPTVSSPRSGAIQSPAPTTRFVCSPPVSVPVTYQIEYQTSAGLRSFSLPLQNTGATVSHYITADIGLREGGATCRVRAVDSAGYPGAWSSTIPFTVSGGIDIAGSISQSTLQQFRDRGWTSLAQASWGGRNVWSSARNNLLRAHAVGMKVAAYAFLNFDNGSTIPGAPANQTGAWQIDQCLFNIGFNGDKASLPYDLKYVIIDVENQFMGTMSTAERVQRIAEAVQRARNYGFWPMIYTRNQGVNTWWNTYTGSSTDFSDLPLWGSYPETAAANFKDHLDLDFGSAWVRFGGWTDRAGKQYQLDTTILGVNVDLNVWNPATWNVTSPPPGQPNISGSASVRRQPGGGYWLDISVLNNGSCEAYAARVTNISLNGAPSPWTQSLNKVDAGENAQFTRSYGAGVGTQGQTVPAVFTVWTGMGPQTYTVWVTL